MKKYIRSSDVSSLSEAERIAIDEFGSSNPGYGCSFIATDGTFVNIYPKIDTHEDLIEYLRDYHNIEFEYQDEEYFVREFGWIRLRTDPVLIIIELPKAASNNQWYSLQQWLDFVEERHSNGTILYLGAVDNRDSSLEFEGYGVDCFSEDILKVCRRYCNSGRLYASSDLITAKRLPNTSFGTIAETGEKCVMQSTGYWVGAGGVHITSYHRVDKPDYNSKGDRVFRQYSMDRRHRFYVETEDPWDDSYESYIYD